MKKLAKPQEIIQLESEIIQLQAKCSALTQAWYDSVCPFKVGENVLVKKGRNKREGIVRWRRLSTCGDAWDFGVEVTLKKGGTQMQHVYSWETLEKITP